VHGISGGLVKRSFEDFDEEAFVTANGEDVFRSPALLKTVIAVGRQVDSQQS